MKIFFSMKRLFLGAAIAMLLIPAVAGAQANQATQTVRGQVCDVASGEPMIGVTVTVENERSSEIRQARLDGRVVTFEGEANGSTLATVSDVDGNFEIKNVPVGAIPSEPVLLATSQYCLRSRW